MRDESYTPFNKEPERRPPEDVLVFVMARQRGDATDSMRGSMRTGPHGWDAVYTLNGELYQSQCFAAEEGARHLATHQDALAAGGWRAVPFQP